MKASDMIIGGILPAAAVIVNIGILVRECFFPICLKRDKAVLYTTPESPQPGIEGWLCLYKTELCFFPDDATHEPVLTNMHEITRVWCSINKQVELQVQTKQGDVLRFSVRHAGSWAVAVTKRMNK